MGGRTNWQDLMRNIFRNSTGIRKKEMQDHGYGEFMVRLWIVPYSDPKLAKLVLVAVPLANTNDATDAHFAKGGGGYPSLLLDDTTIATVGPRIVVPGGNFGLPMVPVLIDSSEDTTGVKTGDLVTLARALWSRCNKPHLVSPTTWEEVTAKSPVILKRQRAEHRWPELMSGGADDADGKSDFI